MIFQVQDISGRIIRLRKKQHSHIIEHKMLANKLEELKETIIKPEFIVQSQKDKSVNYYFRFYKKLKLFLLVVIKYLNGVGFVITAYYSKKKIK